MGKCLAQVLCYRTQSWVGPLLKLVTRPPSHLYTDEHQAAEVLAAGTGVWVISCPNALCSKWMVLQDGRTWWEWC